MKKEKSCGAIIINNDQFLLIKHNKGHWDFPKGHMEKNENEEETALREVKEEVGLDITIDNKYRYVSRYITPSKTDKEVIYFLGKPKSFNLKIQEEEIQEAVWLPFDEALKKITYNESKIILKALQEDINK